MKQLFNRWLPALTFAGWGTVTLVLGSSNKYLGTPFTYYAQIAGVVLLICAVVLAVTRPDAACCAEAACGHGLSRSVGGKISTFAIILLPIALMPFGSKAELEKKLQENRKIQQITYVSKDDVEKRMRTRAGQKTMIPPVVVNAAPLPGSIQPPPPLPLPTNDGAPAPLPAVAPPPTHPAAAPATDFTQYFNKSANGDIIVEVLDLLYAAQDNVLRKDFEGKRVEAVVQYMADAGSKPEGTARFKGVRMFMQCCTADARPIATLVDVKNLPKIPEMSWVKVIGTATFPIERGQRISVLKADTVEVTEPPADTMLQ
jgi:uncharacterized membrane protein YcgQ (UPF0703/DUF1980 family)